MPIDHHIILTSSALLADLRNTYAIHHECPSHDGWISCDINSYRIWFSEENRFHNLPLDPNDLKSVVVDEDYRKLLPWAQRGSRTVWLNQSAELPPVTSPIHDLEINNPASLLEAWNLHQKPSLSDCLMWWEEWKLPENVRRHVTKAAWAAYALAVMLKRKGEKVDPILTHRGGLLHDLDKIQTLGKVHRHGAMGAEFLVGKGYPSAAEIVREHILHTILEPASDKRSWEVKLVYFCDKLTEGDDLVTLEKRFAALGKRYPAYMQKMAQAKTHVWGLNDEICSILKIPDNQHLLSLLNDHYLSIVNNLKIN